jgi:succinylglutamate desuccinylase/GNAT superfamily N-acetyltransferase
MALRIRTATLADLPFVRQLTVDSYVAMAEFFSGSFADNLENIAEKEIKKDLADDKFLPTYFSSPLTHYWVGEDETTGTILGTVALKRNNIEEAELVRMAVGKDIRGKGTGSQLFRHMLAFCQQTKVHRISIVTGNPKSRDFYLKMGAALAAVNDFITPDGHKVSVNRMYYYLHDKIIRKVTIIGGTHGNERLGVELVRQYTADPSSMQRSTFSSQFLLSNPVAVSANRRFIDEDLNRQFTGYMTDSKSTASSSVETKQAEVINSLLGPKRLHVLPTTEEEVAQQQQRQPGSDFIIDLHSSTANTGLVAMISGIKHDFLARRICHRLLQTATTPELKVTSSTGNKADSYSLDSISPSGLAFEVGPIAHGTIDYDLLQKTRMLVTKTLDAIEEYNLAILNEAKDMADVETVRLVSRDLAPIAIDKKSFPEMIHYERVGQLTYPLTTVTATAAVTTAAAVTLTVTESEDYIKAIAGAKSFVLHPSLKSADWQVINDGQPLLIAANGSGEVINFDRKLHLFPSVVAEEKELNAMELVCLFANEAAYEANNAAIAFYKKVKGFVA